MASRIVQYFADKLKTVKEYPITLTKAVYDENGKRLDNKLQEIDNSINDVNNSLVEGRTSNNISNDNVINIQDNYTFQNDGIVYIILRRDNNSGNSLVDVSINGVEIYRSQIVGAGSTNYPTEQFGFPWRVCKNDIINMHASGYIHSAKFYPYN